MERQAIQQYIVVSLAVLLTSCAAPQFTPPQQPPTNLAFDSKLFGEKPTIISAKDIFELRQVQQHQFLNYFRDPALQTIPPHERIYDYLLFATSDFDFHSDTRTAADALDNSSGNCLSLAILTTALANLANVETGYQLVDSTPVFERRGSVISKGIHVRSILYDPTWKSASENESASKRPGIRFDYFPEGTERVRLIGNLSSSAYIAMYYSNIAGEAITTGDINSAFWNLLESLEHSPENGIALNMLAIVYRRAGDEAMAERIYKYGIDSQSDKLSFARNYRYLLKDQGRTAEVEVLDRLLASLDDSNPFNWVNTGRRALAEGEYEEAIKLFKKALNIAPYLHEAHALMAIAHLRLGNTKRSEREMRQALENAQRQKIRSLYQAKLELFTH